MMRKSQLSLTLLAAAAACAVAVSACSGGGGGGGDDDDDGLTNPYDACFVFWDWYYDQGPPTLGHRQYVAAEVASWVSGTLTFGNQANSPLGVLLYDIEFGGAGPTASYVSTNGSANVTAPSNSLHEPVDLTIATAPTWFLESGSGGNATGGTGDLAGGFFNDTDDCFGNGDPEDCLTGTGDVTVTVGSTNLTIGASQTPVGLAYAFCDDLGAFDGNFQERAKAYIKQHYAATK